MKKFIEDWWPLLLIAGWLLWKRHEKRKWMQYGQNPSNGQIPPRPSQQRVIEDYIRQLEKAGYTRTGDCSICGSALYTKGAYIPYDPNSIASQQTNFNLLQACTNPSCERFDERFVLDY
jgi:hypothetical protein